MVEGRTLHVDQVRVAALVHDLQDQIAAAIGADAKIAIVITGQRREAAANAVVARQDFGPDPALVQ